jgi:hypothetical protein
VIALQRKWFARSRAHRVADAEWSSIVVLPNGKVINAQIVDNKTGSHDRLKNVDINRASV